MRQATRLAFPPRSLPRHSRPAALAAGPDNAAAVRQLLLSAGLSPAQLTRVCQHAPLLECDAESEVAPRLAYYAFLRDTSTSSWGWPQVAGEPRETVAAFVTRQPQALERRFSLLPCASPLFVALSKPWDTRHDVPRGWPGVQRFTPKFAGDTSCKEFLGARFPNTTLRFCHQLDFATSGILLAATTKPAAAAAAAAFAARTARKEYACLAFGHPARDSWRRSDALSYDPCDATGFRMRAHSSEVPEGAKAAATSFSVLHRGFLALEGPFHGRPVALLRAVPSTGRRHQIRVHAAASGHPLVGDCAYSPDADSYRTFLHAWALELPLVPKHGVEYGGGGLPPLLRLRAPLPAGFGAAVVPPWAGEE